MKNYKKILLLFLTLLLQISNTQILKASYSKENVKRIKNPERGWVYTKSEMFLNDGVLMGSLDETLVYQNYIFENERDKPLSTTTLNKVKTDLNFVREYRKKIVLSFAYTENDDRDAPLNIIETHIKQLAPILNEYKDVLFIINAGFIGRWGEWHSSSHKLNTLEGKKAVLGLLLNNFPRSVQISLRYPIDKYLFNGPNPLSESEAVSFSTDKSRSGWHNACFLYDSDDRGTFNTRGIVTRKVLDDFSIAESKFAAVGGELCIWEPNDKSRFNCQNGLKELSLFHYTYMNYHQTASQVEKDFPWLQQGCYNEITDKYGYQLYLREAYVSHSVYNIDLKQNFNYSFKIENKGYAAPIYNRPVELVFLSSSNRVTVPLRGVPNLKTWLPDKMIQFSGTIEFTRFSKIMAGQIFSVYLRLPDPSPTISSFSEYSIGFVNVGVYDEATGLNNLGIAIPFGNSELKPPSFQNLGCFKDENMRDLPQFWGRNFERNSCFQKANSVGHKFFGLQFNGECFSGNSFGKYGKIDMSNCNTKCSADESQNCGGSFASFIMSVSPTPTPGLDELGCFKDSTVRDLQNSWGIGYERSLCFQKANSVGHKFFGLQFNGECFTGNSYGRYGKIDMSNCNTRCIVDQSQNCGGNFANIIYTTNRWGPFYGTELGCYEDDSKVRDLGKYWGRYFEKNYCFKLALRAGHKYFGLQYHGECYSGNSYGKYPKLDMSKCDTKCYADSTQNCGGPHKNLIYEIKRNILEVNEEEDVLDY